MNNKRIVFMGTPEISASVLEGIISSAIMWWQLSLNQIDQ